MAVMTTRPSVDHNASTLIRSYQSEAPIPVAKIARDLGIDVKQAFLPLGISGEIRPISNTDRYKITVNKAELKQRQRFTIAHELAHFLLHKDLIKDGISDNVMYRSRLSNKIEAEANRLAAEILMPASILKRIIHEESLEINEEAARLLSKRFNVSLPAMKVRLGLGDSDATA